MNTNIAAFLKQHFSDVEKHTPYTKERLEEFLKLGPLHYFIPKSLGGRMEGAGVLGMGSVELRMSGRAPQDGDVLPQIWMVGSSVQGWVFGVVRL